MKINGKGVMQMTYLLTGGFMVLDFGTGLVKAIKERNYNSSVMREGLLHKCGSILCVTLGILVEYANSYLGLGISVPIASAICTYISLMEIGSIIENIGKINPEIVPEKLREYFAKLK